MSRLSRLKEAAKGMSVEELGRKLLLGLERTQAEEVHVNPDQVEAVLGPDILLEVMVKGTKASLSQKRTKERSLVKAMKEEGRVETHNIATFDREMLVAAIKDVLDPEEDDSPSTLDFSEL